MTPRPTSLAGRALALLVDYAGELRAEDVAAHLWPPVRMSAPPVGTFDERRAAFAAVQAARAAHREATTHRAAKVLARLQQGGLVDVCGAPRLAGWYVEIEAKRGRDLALAFATLEHGVKVKPAHRAIVAETMGMPCSPVREWLGTSRARREAYADLVRAGVIIAPTQRVPTAEGVRVVEGWRATA